MQKKYKGKIYPIFLFIMLILPIFAQTSIADIPLQTEEVINLSFYNDWSNIYIDNNSCDDNGIIIENLIHGSHWIFIDNNDYSKGKYFIAQNDQIINFTNSDLDLLMYKFNMIIDINTTKGPIDQTWDIGFFNTTGKMALEIYMRRYVANDSIYIQNQLEGVTAPRIWYENFTGGEITLGWKYNVKDLMQFETIYNNTYKFQENDMDWQSQIGNDSGIYKIKKLHIVSANWTKIKSIGYSSSQYLGFKAEYESNGQLRMEQPKQGYSNWSTYPGSIIPWPPVNLIDMKSIYQNYGNSYMQFKDIPDPNGNYRNLVRWRYNINKVDAVLKRIDFLIKFETTKTINLNEMKYAIGVFIDKGGEGIGGKVIADGLYWLNEQQKIARVWFNLPKGFHTNIFPHIKWLDISICINAYYCDVPISLMYSPKKLDFDNDGQSKLSLYRNNDPRYHNYADYVTFLSVDPFYWLTFQDDRPDEVNEFSIGVWSETGKTDFDLYEDYFINVVVLHGDNEWCWRLKSPLGNIIKFEIRQRGTYVAEQQRTCQGSFGTWTIEAIDLSDQTIKNTVINNPGSVWTTYPGYKSKTFIHNTPNYPFTNDIMFLDFDMLMTECMSYKHHLENNTNFKIYMRHASLEIGESYGPDDELNTPWYLFDTVMGRGNWTIGSIKFCPDEYGYYEIRAVNYTTNSSVGYSWIRVLPDNFNAKIHECIFPKIVLPETTGEKAYINVRGSTGGIPDIKLVLKMPNGRKTTFNIAKGTGFFEYEYNNNLYIPYLEGEYEIALISDTIGEITGQTFKAYYKKDDNPTWHNDFYGYAIRLIDSSTIEQEAKIRPYGINIGLLIGFVICISIGCIAGIVTDSGTGFIGGAGITMIICSLPNTGIQFFPMEVLYVLGVMLTILLLWWFTRG